MKTTNVRRFEAWEDAYALCREQDKPLMVSVPLFVKDGVETREVATIYPSGKAKHLHYENLTPQTR